MVVEDRKEGIVAEQTDRFFFQEIGCSRKVAIARAREGDMLVYRHSWKRRSVGVESRREEASTTGLRPSCGGGERRSGSRCCGRATGAGGECLRGGGQSARLRVPGWCAGCSVREGKHRCEL
jgi:hypothetical protein